MTNRGDFLKEKVINFTRFLQEQGVEDLPLNEVERMPSLLIWSTLEFNLPVIDARDIDKLHNAMQSKAESTLDLKHIIAQVQMRYLDMPIEQRDKFWRYLECFNECINSEALN